MILSDVMSYTGIAIIYYVKMYHSFEGHLIMNVILVFKVVCHLELKMH